MATRFHCLIADEAIEVRPGACEAPDITVIMKESDYLDVINGKLKRPMAVLTGKLRIVGDLGLALKLESLFTATAGVSVTSIQQVMDGMKEAFNRDAAKGLRAAYQFDLT